MPISGIAAVADESNLAGSSRREDEDRAMNAAETATNERRGGGGKVGGSPNAPAPYLSGNEADTEAEAPT